MMDSRMLRQKFLEFFKARGHTIVPSSSLIPDDPSVLLTTAGMQQFKPYYTGEADSMATIHPTLGKPLGSRNAVSIQKSFRTSDIDEVGDERHLTFFEMMGNFSFGRDARVPCEAGTTVCGYFKEDAIRYAFDFLTKEVGLRIEYVTVFEGLDAIGVPEDTESQKIWRALDPNIKIIKQGMDDVFWGPTGSSGPCGPTTEIYCKNGAGEDIEIWNIVFNEFFFNGSREELLSGSSGKKLEPLKTPGVDTGMGLERLAMCTPPKKKDVFETDLFFPIMEMLPTLMPNKSKRIISDHARTTVFLLADGVRPGNKDREYILRRLMRRAIAHLNDKDYFEPPEGRSDWIDKRFIDIVKRMIELYGTQPPYEYLAQKKDHILEIIRMEEEKFSRVFFNGQDRLVKRIYELDRQNIYTLPAEDIFYAVTTDGFALEWIRDVAKEYSVDLDIAGFERLMEQHREVSRAGSVAKFGGHGLYLKTGEVTIRDESEVEKVTRLHTATHLLHAALRGILGSEVRQDGSDIMVERTRFDFRFPRKVSPEELRRVEQWVNDMIRRDLKVEWQEMPYEEAVQKGALGFFHEKYPARVKVYSVFDAGTGEVISRELCGGPHVARTAEIGAFKIIKEESSSAGVRRIRGVLVD